MTSTERTAFNAGVKAVRQMALIAAVTIEARDDARKLRQQASAAALQGLAEGSKALMLETAVAKGRCLHTVQNKASSLVADAQDEP